MFNLIRNNFKEVLTNVLYCRKKEVKITKEQIIPCNSIIVSNSIVKGIFTSKSTLIGGNPNKQVK